MVWFPFVFISAGVIIGFVKLTGRFLTYVEQIGSIALIVLMFTIGVNIGISDTVIKSIGIIGLQCVAITICAITFSIVAVIALEKTVLPLTELQEKISSKSINVGSGSSIANDSDKKISPLVWIIPVCVIAGTVAGLFLPVGFDEMVDNLFTVSLAVLYTSVGVELAQNRSVFTYIKLIGWKIILIPLAIAIGSIMGGFVVGVMLNIPFHISVLSAGGMGYYSITGAFMTQTYSIDVGAYGFLVNVLRDFITVLLLPVLIRISNGAPIAGGASSNMDTMLMPVTKFVGAELGLVGLITGTILTFAVPVLLPILMSIV